MPKGQKNADIDLNGVAFGATLDPQLFNDIAKRCASTIAGSEKKFNKPSQLRRFYDELVMWATKVEQNPGAEKFAEYRPFILMLNAKAAYAAGRELVDANFVALLAHCLRQVEDPRALGLVKLFFEAFLGFYKEARPSDS
jgi:CRISPR-associated protein Csm2